MCEHQDFKAIVAVNRLEDTQPMAFTADIKICCAHCAQEFEFIGFPVGLSPTHATVNPSGTELRVPLKPAGQAETPTYASWAMALPEQPGADA
jgi:hypothetical protein